jgi:hypothetical protein
VKKVTVRATRPLPQLQLDEVGVLDYDGNVPALIANGILQIVGPDPDSVPQGTISFVLNWVGDDPDRALRALDNESSKDSPRIGLIRKLKALLPGIDVVEPPVAFEELVKELIDDYQTHLEH